MQNYFATPSAVETFLNEYGSRGHGTKAGNSGFRNLKEVQAELAQKIAPTAVRLDIFCVLEEKLEAVISVLDTRKGTWSLYTFPADTRVELGETRYRRLSAQFPALPQMFEIGILTEYMGREHAAKVLAAVFEDMLFCSFKTAVTCTQEELSSWCKKEGEIYTATQEIMDFLALSPRKKGVFGRVKDAQDASLVPYAESIALLEPQDFTAQMISGERVGDGYRLDENKARRQLAGSGIKEKN
ncbi:MAG: hypothetical protein K2N63_14630 [Lachnospiraceae bacterium]|nr:hypothetical protein [Lachnospiraceae bacterium]